MKKFTLKKINTIIIILIFLGAAIVRFYNYEERITFGPEQAMSLITSGRMVTEKFTLLGNQNLQRQTSSGHSLFAGALFNYSLIPLQLVFNFDPYPITIFFTLLNLFSGLVIYKLVKEMLSEKVAIVSTFLFLFYRLSIYHSMFIWNQNYMFLIGTLSLYLLYIFRKTKHLKEVFLLGLISGVAYTMQDLYLITAGIVFIYLVKNSKVKFITFLYFVMGAAIPNLPAIVFDFRHDFYHVRTSVEFIVDTFRGASGANFQYYHFLHLLPFILIIGAILIVKLYRKNKVFALTLLTLFTFLNLNSTNISFDSPTGMPASLTVRNTIKAAKAIVDDTPENFNVAVLVDFDTRGHVLRYPLEFIYHKKPKDVSSYPQSDKLYVLGKEDYDFVGSEVWELSTFNKNKILKIAEVSDDYFVYKLSK